ncbi:MAG TPA: hypothetical protein VKU85_07665, partial [bacterium]|nr:hypothetical protein [bacterium]
FRAPAAAGFTISTPVSGVQPLRLAWLFSAIVGLALIVSIAWTVIRKVFLLDEEYPVTFKPEPTSSGNLLFLRPDPKDRRRYADESEYLPVTAGDLVRDGSVERVLERCSEKGVRNVCLVDFDNGLKDPEQENRKLELLERLLELPGFRIVVFTEIDPLYYLTSRAEDREVRQQAEGVPIARWARVLERFAKVRQDAYEGVDRARAEAFATELMREAEARRQAKEPQPDQSLKADVAQGLAREAWPSAELQDIARDLARSIEARELTPDDLVDHVRDHAVAYYRRIWSTCSTDERIVLFRVAHGGFVSWRMASTARSLLRRALLVRSPNYRLMNESFRQFVLQVVTPDEVDAWESELGPSTWARIRVPISIAFVAIAAFFFATQQEAFRWILGLLGALAAGAPLVIRLLGAVMYARKPATRE